MSFITITQKDQFLCLESLFMAEKISFDSIEDVLIFHVSEQQDLRVYIFLNKPIIYELKSEKFFNKILFSVFKIFNKNPLEIKTQLERNNLLTLLKLLENNLNNVLIPNDLDNSILWRTVDNGIQIPRTKLIYSKNNLSLTEVMRKHKILIDK
ncbi:hypothetical protein [Chryseobacterium sp. MMS23-Vi53]|uniref:hypothetical protein n=1 Tax=Chryseobacterium sp. MMS23-Vi53 TaxID=3386644 RepID=UPI0039E96145